MSTPTHTSNVDVQTPPLSPRVNSGQQSPVGPLPTETEWGRSQLSLASSPEPAATLPTQASTSSPVTTPNAGRPQLTNGTSALVLDDFTNGAQSTSLPSHHYASTVDSDELRHVLQQSLDPRGGNRSLPRKYRVREEAVADERQEWREWLQGQEEAVAEERREWREWLQGQEEAVADEWREWREWREWLQGREEAIAEERREWREWLQGREEAVADEWWEWREWLQGREEAVADERREWREWREWLQGREEALAVKWYLMSPLPNIL
ncbi:hypothetical protein CPB84DRAFT_1744514 [Gymnopilus junonius]|uniref:Uncharacterized protein n=1 Tax=Gymnopilus junonius TaxID=109634 RepID=A0A9P5NWB2_GYMJU|nr:hypothetical protein CPB84DRAFT_1744514 [Gymnopilus junonius]